MEVTYSLVVAVSAMRFARLLVLLYIMGLYCFLLVFFLKLKKNLLVEENVTIKVSTLIFIGTVSTLTFLYGLNIIIETILPVLDKRYDGDSAYENTMYIASFLTLPILDVLVTFIFFLIWYKLNTFNHRRQLN